MYPVTASVGKLTIAAFSATVDGGIGVMQFPAGEIAVSDSAVNYLVLYALSDVERPLQAEDGTPLLGEGGQSLTSTVPGGSYVAVPQPALAEAAMSEFVILREFTTPAADGTYPEETQPPSGDGGGGYGGGGRYQQNVQVQ